MQRRRNFTPPGTILNELIFAVFLPGMLLKDYLRD